METNINLELSKETDCRLCLSNVSTNMHIFSDYGQKVCVQAKVWKLFKFWVRHDDTLPKMICQLCYNQLDSFHYFFLKVEEVQRKLGLILSETELIPTDTALKLNDLSLDPCSQSLNSNITEETTSNEQFGIIKDLSNSFWPENQFFDQNLHISPANDILLIKHEENFNLISTETKNSETKSHKTSNNSDSASEKSNLNKSKKQSSKKKKKNDDAIVKACELAEFYKFSCEECSTIGKQNLFSTFGNLCDHYTKKHNSRGYVMCCGRKIFSRKSVRTHFLKHQRPEMFKCDLCGKQLANKFCLKTHKLRHTGEEPYICSTCGKCFAAKSDLLKHEQKQHPPESEIKSYPCEICGKKFKHRDNLNIHKNFVHLKIKAEICHICAKTFSNRSGLKVHMLSHDDIKEHQMQCNICGKWLKNKLTMRTHMKTHQDGVLIPCPHCDRTYKIRDHLNKHLKSHSDVRPYQCSYCGKCFKMKQTLTVHLRQHTGEKPYACPYCPSSFANSANYYSHKKRFHCDSGKNNTNPSINITFGE